MRRYRGCSLISYLGRSGYEIRCSQASCQCYTNPIWIGGGGGIYESRNRSTQSFISVDMCSDVNRLRNSDLVVKQIYNFSWQNVISKVRNAGKLIPFVFKTVRVNMLLKIAFW